jgi:hypothetical protein
VILAFHELQRNEDELVVAYLKVLCRHSLEELRKMMKNLKNSVFWDITSCNPVNVNRHFGGTFLLHRQSRRISYARIQHETGSKQSKPPEESTGST